MLLLELMQKTLGNIQKGTFLFLKLGTLSQGTKKKKMAALADVALAEAGLVIIDFFYPFLLPSGS